MANPAMKTEYSDSCLWVEPILMDPEELGADEAARVLEAIGKAGRADPTFQPECVLEAILDQRAALWALCDFEAETRGYLVTQMQEHSTGYSVFLIHSAAMLTGRVSEDNMRSIVEFLSGVARSMDMDAVRIVGRKGWARILPDFVEVERTIEKRLARETH